MAALAVLAPGAGAFELDAASLRYDPAQVTEADPVLAEVFAMARDLGIRVGTWGGASRDLLLDRGAPPPESDVDMVYDSKELKDALFGRGFMGFFRSMGRIGKGYWRMVRAGGLGAVRRYTWLDMQPERSLTMSIHKLMNSGALTLNQVGLMSDGSIYDPNGGLGDAREGLLRYRAPRPVAEMIETFDDIHNPSPADVLRALRFKTQYPELEWAPGTLETLREVMAHYAPGSARTTEVASFKKGLGGALRKVLPDALEKPVSAVKNFLGKQSYKDLYPYVAKNAKRLLTATQDPRQALALYRELGLDAFLEEVGLGDTVTRLEEMAAAAPEGNLLRIPAEFGGGTPGDEAGSGGTSPGDEAMASDAAAAWRRVRDQAYAHYLRAQEDGDPARAAAQYQIYLQASQREGGAP